jgi:myo-inositol 2-dehydrogenase / D-chiro-inositol 1-dehydrogenase
MNNPPSDFSRRDFLAASSLAAGAMAFPSIGSAQHKADRIRIGLIGCGGRGTGAANNALEADPGVQLVAMGDVFPERLETSLNGLSNKYAGSPGRVDVPKERQFTGLDAYKHVLAQDIDVVLLAAPPGFRPLHFAAAVEANKHIFCEKPMGTDIVGARSIMDAARKAKEKKLSVVAGFCWRYSDRRALFEKIHGGAIGEVRGLYHTYLTGPVKPMPAPETRREGMSDVEWQLRNWMNFVWLSGDGLVEQACHSVDKMMWAMKDVAPLRCTANGGRQVPNPGGNIFDHITVHYEWANGVRGVMAQRQIGGCYNDNSDYVTGEKGIATTKGGLNISGANPWKYDGPRVDMYVQEHRELYASVRSGAAHNDGDWMVQSTIAALMGRMAGYTGQEVTWEHMMKSQDRIFPETLSMDMALPVAPIASPGKTKLV